MSSRAEVIVELLERYDELVNPGRAGGPVGDGTAVAIMPSTYTDDVKELERLMVLMRDTRRRLWWQVNERYIRATRTTRDVPVRRRGKHGRTVTVIERRVVATWNPGVDERLVGEGVGWLADRWGLPLEPFLPAALVV